MAAKVEIPFLDISVEALEGLETKSEKWKELCDRVREACETHGIFFLVYDKIPTSLREEIFVALKTLFDLPEETKNKHVNPRPYRSYLGKCPVIPFHESFGVDEAPTLDASQAFTTLMWPEGNPKFLLLFFF
ncbi:hypothetical protein OIU77_005242 [Salix suchowensis]|uniref:Non-haem dioxygenase N-terminal domain-containing protein n=1 Tax=Salix suchowensis TaxID=1278906 RepID=A0ABQ9AQT5_9ROSI|nr:hypothetical protein OIU77_005242 [Salix suchowensis]